MHSWTLRRQFTLGLGAVLAVALAVLCGTRWLGKTARFHHLEREHLVQVLALTQRLQAAADGRQPLARADLLQPLAAAQTLSQRMHDEVWPAERAAFALIGFGEIVAWPVRDIAALGRLRQAAEAAPGEVVDPALARQLAAQAAPLQAEADALGRAVAEAAGFVQVAVVLANGLGLAAVIAVFLTLRRATLGPLLRALQAAQRMARGDLVAPPLAHGADEVGQLNAALDDMKRSLAQVVADVRQRSTTVASSADAVAGGSADLSRRAGEQAATLQDTGGRLAVLLASLQQGGRQVRAADALAVQARQVAGEGGQAVARVVGRMDEILAASRRIADINGVIDGLAFRTNLLALNAAVEAARAGEQGRGFAVVAAEVRGLAQRSTAAAREVAALVDDTVAKVALGVAEVDRAGHTIDEVVRAVQQVSDLVNGVAGGLAGQEGGLASIDDAMGRLDQATHHNAALARQSQAAAEAVRTQSAALVAAVGQFRLAGA